jgi:hypothetical protein
MLNPSAGRRIDLDFDASTPIASEVADAMRGVLAEPSAILPVNTGLGSPQNVSSKKHARSRG